MALSVKLYRVVGKGKDRATFRLIWDGGGGALSKRSRGRSTCGPVRLNEADWGINTLRHQPWISPAPT